MTRLLKMALPVLLAAVAIACETPATSHDQRRTDIYVAPLMAFGEMVSVGDPVNITSREGYDNQPSFNHDGSLLLYTSGRYGRTDIHGYDLTSGESRAVTRTLQHEFSPTRIPGDDGFSVVRVGLDGKQGLWRFEADGTRPLPLLDWGWKMTVGYHAWLDEEKLALYVLGEPSKLVLANLATGQVDVVAENVGRSLHRIPHRNGLSFSAEDPDGSRWIKELDLETREIRPLVRIPWGSQDHAWAPSGTLFAASGSRLYYWTFDIGDDWFTVGDFYDAVGGAITRLAVSPNGDRIAMVADRSLADL